MSELLPSGQAQSIREGLIDYLRTTFALADADAGAALQEFFEDSTEGIFKGPFLRLRLPFKSAEDGWRETLDWYEGFPPYGHQAEAFKRLSSLDLDDARTRPQPTLVTTGTGSGKTEAFLFPILDHVLRAKRAGTTGMKALILYPMNALANDQAQRLATMISSSPELSGVTAALYTGQEGPSRTKVTSDGLITDRGIIRDSAPDILLTNYKMLDQTLLRAADTDMWKQSAHSLQYLVLDEFHTYDGAQGTDVTMLLRRLGMALKSYWPADDPTVTEADRMRPLGRITPVATSATLGDKGDPAAMLEFARTVFGDEFDEDSVVTESRLSFDEWAADGVPALPELTAADVATALGKLAESDSTNGRSIADTMLEVLAPGEDLSDERGMLRVVKGLPLTSSLAQTCTEATALSDLTTLVPGDAEAAEEFLLAYVATLSHIRAVVGKSALSVDLHLWVRELTRIDRSASLVPSFHWSDDGTLDDDNVATLPAIYCRHCGRSGWGVHLAPVGEDLDQSDPGGIRKSKALGSERFRPLIFAPVEGDQVREGVEIDGFRWLWATARKLSATEPDDEIEIREGRVVPVLTHVADDAGTLAKDDSCPSCLRKDGIRFLGSAIATMLSVSMSTLFGTRGLDNQEKKALVFTDSVQDAAHRAGFVQARSHSLTLRSVIRDAIGSSEATLDQVVDRMIDLAGDDPHRRYRLLPPDFADHERFAEFWQADTLAKVPARVRARVRKRLLLDVELEFGLQSRVGRTLELTGTIGAKVDAPAHVLTNAVRHVLDSAAQQTIEGLHVDDATKVAWVRGVLERMRERGAIAHEWFSRYQREDGNRFSIWGGRPRSDGMPAFPSGRAAPAYPRVGSANPNRYSDLDPVTGPKTWFAQWTAKMLGIASSEGAVLAKLLLERLAHAGIIQEVRSDSGATIYQILPSSIFVAPVALKGLRAKQNQLTCTVCRTIVPGPSEVIDQLSRSPCLVGRCSGGLERSAGDDNFYRRLYTESDVQRVVAREHTGQLPDKVRLEYENGFKSSSTNPDAPNVLVATPTLEMGIDIGDLSTVMLASLPKSVASYLQRVGRAGRLTGNSLNLAFVTGRGDQLPRLGDPLSVINGEVRPPSTYVDAEEILRRQYVASVADRLARDASAPHPQRASEAMNSDAEDGYLRTLVGRAEENADQYVDDFLSGFPTLRKEVGDELKRWATPASSSDSSDLAQRIYTEAFKWKTQIEQLNFRTTQIEHVLPELDQIAASPAATDDDKAALRVAKSALKLTKKQIAELRGEYWISILEQHGLLPNYTLFDDSVDLDVAFSWIDPDSGAYEDESLTFSRGAALALREFAPGATFYARGYKVLVDAVDLGHEGSAIHEQAFCPGCGYVRMQSGDLDSSPCPRCGSAGIGDVQQRLQTVELTRVSSAMKREEAAIDDSSDERKSERFNLVISADVDPTKIARQWFVDGLGFGVRHLRDMNIQWTNVGRGSVQGQKTFIAGEEHVSPLFRLCVHCGQLDTATQANRPSEHRPWCPQRKKVDEDTRTIALTRTLATEGLVVRLPALISLGDEFAVPSLSAAMLLGLRERIGGAPDHIAVEVIVDPTLGDEFANHDALLLHDIVPGGTGYLADLSHPEEFWLVLHKAWEVLRDCECQNENRLACHRCLLPFAGNRVNVVSRLAAERHLRDILTSGSDGDVPATSGWDLIDEAIQQFDPETQIEKKFRSVLRKRLEAVGAKVTEKPGPNGNRWIIRAGGARVWQLEPQQNLGPAKPDFVLTCSQPLPTMAIFCDGWRFHASPEINRLADDAQKRRDLRDAGHFVVGVTWSDLEKADADGKPKYPPAWFDPGAANQLKQVPAGGVTERAIKVMAGGPIDIMLDWIQNPEPEAKEKLANLTPFALAPKSAQVMLSPTVPLATVAVDLLEGKDAPAGDSQGWHWKHDTVSLVARHAGGLVDDIEVAVVLDDRLAALGPSRKEPWNLWISLSNALALRERPTVITTLTAAGLEDHAPVEYTPSVPEDWAEIYAGATEPEQAIIKLLADRGLDKPDLGVESAGGIPLSITWPSRHLAIRLDIADDELDELMAEGWVIIPADIEAIEEALAERIS